MKKIAIVFIFVFSAVLVNAQSDGSTPPTPTPEPAESATVSPAIPTSSSIPSSVPASQGTATPAPASIVTPIGRPVKTPISAPIPSATPPEELPTKPVINMTYGNTEPQFGMNYMYLLIGALVAGGLGSLLFLKLNQKNNKKQKENSKCLNIKKLMEDKLNELTDLKIKIQSSAEKKVRKEIRDTVGGTKAGEALKLIEKREKEYARLKELYEKCITDRGKEKVVFIFQDRKSVV